MSQLLDRAENFVRFPDLYRPYYNDLFNKLHDARHAADLARSMGYDPVLGVECDLAYDLADRVEMLLGVEVSSRLRELLERVRTEQAALILAEEVALGKFGLMETEAALSSAIRVGLAVVTDGITVAPLQGISSVRIKSNDDGTNYAAVYFAGPIRSAGGTEAAFTLVIADHVRKALGLEKYHPNAWGEDEVGRFLEELRIYEREVGNFQFRIADQDVQQAILHIPVEIDGVETDPVEVVVHRGLRRIETDRVRGGALRVLNDGIIGRSRKLLQLVRDLSIRDWEWLGQLSGVEDSQRSRVETSHFEEVISGRPVLSFPGKVGGFRLRYGRAYNTGLSTVGVHPGVATILDYPFVAGTQVKLSIPGKAASLAFVDSIETPIVELNDKSVVRVRDIEHAESLRDKIRRILYLGDILVSFGDFLENNVVLPQSGYVEEWWAQDLAKALERGLYSKDNINLDFDIEDLVSDPFHNLPTALQAFQLCQSLEIPLHPRYLFFWDLATLSEIINLRQGLQIIEGNDESCVLAVSSGSEVKPILEKLGIPHRVEGSSIIIDGDVGYSVMRTLALPYEHQIVSGWTDIPSLLTILSKVIIRRKSSVFVGVRMGRPEKAMPRKMKPPVHLLFPVAYNGGSTRNILQASEKELIQIDLINLVCSRCGLRSFSMKCKNCGGSTNMVRRCPSCGREVGAETCPLCRIGTVLYSSITYPIKDLLKAAMQRVNYSPPPPLKGVQGLTNATKIPEPLEKGILRRKYDLSIYKDGTVRFDATNAPLTHFRPKEISISVERLRMLGYKKDIYDQPLESEDQLVELFVQDVILPVEAGEYLVKVARFVDDLLIYMYEMKAYYNIRSRTDLIGHLIVGLAPHTSVGVLGRIIGFTDCQICFAHPYWHSAKRRDCDGDQDAIMLLMDILLNFSKQFLPDQIGGMMDAPLILQPIIIPHEVQRQAHNFDIAQRYPIEFYNSTVDEPSPHELVEMIETVRSRLKTEEQLLHFHFTHPTSTIRVKRTRSMYSTLKSLPQKLEKQIELAMKINAVDPNQVVSAVLKTHILPDIIGNMKAYTSQSFRCKSCGQQYRRIPLKSICLSCGGQLQQTVSRASVEKYLRLGLRLAENYEVGEYLRKRFEMASEELTTLFTKKSGNQLELTDFFETANESSGS